MTTSRCWMCLGSLVCLSVLTLAAEEQDWVETFEPIHAERFLTPIPNKNTEVRDGVLWTRGSSGGKYPPMFYLGVEGADLTLSFRYRHLQAGGWLWFFVDGDDGFGSTDHLLRVKLLRTGLQLQVDGHSKDPAHPQRQMKREADAVSGAYRLNEVLPLQPLSLQENVWHEVKLTFRGDILSLHLDGQLYVDALKRPGFKGQKRKLLWMQNGGEKGIELDDLRVSAVQP
ncbi:hypothetical protein SAMN02745166_00228 [Prosthecobacter debontii]|uniref:3-keto-disaccharide hydrolase domain-containing protein n=1 Tax=Prosthecobacter debontii TaxID=48467 RepID=A0A1T4WHA9_9BACT|nr:hypothetical protein [Prosthecobacter debontii]SKA76680.1 hypothetical protein SAMN02745166_00228 [Prosthecobacter debontii]